jgi:hypothetical protein
MHNRISSLRDGMRREEKAFRHKQRTRKSMKESETKDQMIAQIFIMRETSEHLHREQG